MSNNKQTAVEWLVEQIIKKHPIITQYLPNYNFDKELIEQAKEMEKQQIEISDEEIEKGAEENTCYMNDFILGAKWYREQLKPR